MKVDTQPYVIIGMYGNAVSFLSRELTLDTSISRAMVLYTVEQAQMVGDMLLNHNALDGYIIRSLAQQMAEMN